MDRLLLTLRITFILYPRPGAWSESWISAELNGHTMLYAASLPKIAILLGAAVAIDEGRLTLDDELQTDLDNMIRYSCNSCATKVLNMVGHEELLEILQSPEYKFYDKQVQLPAAPLVHQYAFLHLQQEVHQCAGSRVTVAATINVFLTLAGKKTTLPDLVQRQTVAGHQFPKRLLKKPG